MFPGDRADLGSRESENRACVRARSPMQMPSLKGHCRAARCPRCLFSAATFALRLLNHKHRWTNLVLERLGCAEPSSSGFIPCWMRTEFRLEVCGLCDIWHILLVMTKNPLVPSSELFLTYTQRHETFSIFISW